MNLCCLCIHVLSLACLFPLLDILLFDQIHANASTALVGFVAPPVSTVCVGLDLQNFN